MGKACLHTDGGSRGNPGLAGLGFDLVAEDGKEIAQGGWYIAHASNNVAEYSALVWGLQNALAAKVTHLQVCVDSELVARQMNGLYKVKSEDLKPLYTQAKSLFLQFEDIRIQHVYRSENKNADRLANEAMDAKGAVGSYLVSWEGIAVQNVKSKKEKALPYTAERSKNVLPIEPLPLALEYNEDDTTAQDKQPCIKEMKEDIVMERNNPYTGLRQLSGETYEHIGGHYEMTVKDHFDAAHALIGYEGPCRFLHGHTWEVEAVVAGESLDSVGILYDFKALKNDLHHILENFDHRCINDVPPFDVINSTAENMARVIFYELEKTFPAGVYLQEVVIWESPQAKVVYRP